MLNIWPKFNILIDVQCFSQTKERRHIQHMQYLAWPDHGVPSDPELFLQFTEKVRDARKTTLLQEIDQSLKQLQLNDVDGSVSSMERPVIKKDCIKRNDKPDSPLYTSAHQFISAANPPIIVHCKYKSLIMNKCNVST